MKELYKFKIKNGDVDVDFAFLEPTKASHREGDMIYAKTYADCVRNGLLTNTEAAKLANERGGVFSEQEKEEYVKALTEYVNKDKELQDFKATSEVGEAKDKHIKDLEDDVSMAKNRVLLYQSKQDSVFEFTAESKARDNVILHYALALTYSNGKVFFEGKDFITKLKTLDEKQDDFKDAVMKRAVWYSTAVWYGVKNLEEAKYPEDAQVTTPVSPENK